ncbi:WD repeat [Cryptosporidium xiaoi]|uniref:WD repeat n=1 Tax=Cryptosporidium xiaoi TaxID=659607 RepID=A0AAV9Y1T9_9CRYT
MISYKFNNLLGVPYNSGDLVFTSDSSNLISNVDNRICINDIKYNRTHVLGCESRSNIRRMCISPDEKILICIDVDNYGIIVNFNKGLILNRMKFPGSEVNYICFSNSGEYVAAAIDNGVYIWNSPDINVGWQLILYRKHMFHNARVNTISWSDCDSFIVTSSNDLTVRLISIKDVSNFDTVAFVTHKNPVMGAFFTKNSHSIFSVSSEGVIIFWMPSSERNCNGKKVIKPEKILPRQKAENKRKKIDSNTNKTTNSIENNQVSSNNLTSEVWIEALRAYVNQSKGSIVNGCTFNKNKNLVAISTSNGVFTLYGISVGLSSSEALSSNEVVKDPDNIQIHSIHTFSLSNSPLTSMKFSNNGEWLAIGASKTNQLVIWEWQSESYVLKQQGHNFGVQCSSFSPAGLDKGKWTSRASHDDNLGIGCRTIIATGGIDGKLKLWDISTGYNFVTFSDHTSPISKVTFNPQGNVVLSASLDGTIRAYDIMRYRNFRTFTINNIPEKGNWNINGGNNKTSNIEQFTCLAMDRTGDIVVAGTQGEYKIYVWCFRTGKILDILHGHTSNIVDVSFCPSLSSPGILASASWDGTVRIWDLYGRIKKGAVGESLTHSSSVLSIAFDPRGNNILAASTLSGNITFWDINKGNVEGIINGLRDIHSGRGFSDAFSANNSIKGEKKSEKIFGGNSNDNINRNQHFSSICYTSNGRFLLASSRNSPRVCLYDTVTKILVSTVNLTNSRFFHGIRMELNSGSNKNKKRKYVSSSDNPNETWNPINRLNDKESIINDHKSLPGTVVGEFTKLNIQKQFTVYHISFSQNSTHWIASTSHGAYLYTLDILGNSYLGSSSHLNTLDTFKKQIITKEVNYDNIRNFMNDGDYLRAFILALAMNDLNVLTNTYIHIPISSVDFIVQNIASFLQPNILNFLRIVTNPSNKQFFRIERHLIWLESIIRIHGNVFLNLNETFNNNPTTFFGISDYKIKNHIEVANNNQDGDNSDEDDNNEDKNSNNINKLKQNKLALLSSNLNDCDTRSIFLAILMNLSQIYSFSKQVYDSNSSIIHYLSLKMKQ